jgi:hypothetical protein
LGEPRGIHTTMRREAIVLIQSFACI